MRGEQDMTARAAKTLTLVSAVVALVSQSCGSSTSSSELALTGIEPAEGYARGGEVVTLRGRGFEGSVQVSFGDAPAASVKRVSSELLEVQTPPHLAQSVDVKIAADGASLSLHDGFTFLPLELSFREAPAWYLPELSELPVSHAVAADFDRDGHTDLLVGVRNAGSMLLRNSGNGSFAGAQLTPPDDPPDASTQDAQPDVGASDAESDAGALDAASADAATTVDAGGTTSRDALWVHATHRVIVADFNDDEAPDVLVCNQGRQPSRILLNDGSGGFDEVPGALPEDAEECRGAVVTDLDGDGMNDIAMLGGGRAGSGKSYVRLFLREGGTSEPSFSPIAGLEPAAALEDAQCGTVSAAAEATATTALRDTNAAYGEGACELSFDTAGTTDPITLWFALPDLPAVPSDVLAELRQQGASAKVQVRLRDAEGEQFTYDAGAIGATWSHVQAKKPQTWTSEGDAANGVIDLPLAAVGVSILPTATSEKGTLAVDSLKLMVPEVGAVIVDDFERKDFALSWSQRMVSIVAGDLDDDGDVDLLLSSDEAGKTPLVLLRNDGPTDGFSLAFREMVSGAFDAITDPVTATTLIDLDDDGDLDIVAGAVGGQDRLLSNDGNAHFFDDTLATMPVDRVSARGLALDDFDMDGRPDLLIANDGAANRLYVSRLARGFLDATPSMPLRQDHTLCLVPLDADGDGDEDIFVLNAQGESAALLVSVEEAGRTGD